MGSVGSTRLSGASVLARTKQAQDKCHANTRAYVYELCHSPTSLNVLLLLARSSCKVCKAVGASLRDAAEDSLLVVGVPSLVALAVGRKTVARMSLAEGAEAVAAVALVVEPAWDVVGAAVVDDTVTIVWESRAGYPIMTQTQSQLVAAADGVGTAEWSCARCIGAVGGDEGGDEEVT